MCSASTWEKDYTNIMSYASDTCLNHFTAKQGARMRCVADELFDGKWWQSAYPSPVLVHVCLLSFIVCNIIPFYTVYDLL